MSKEKGFQTRYEVRKASNPAKQMDCLVLEFDDPIARKGIRAWAEEMRRQGYEACANEVFEKLERQENA
jgi:TusA-related sulfurtransferase